MNGLRCIYHHDQEGRSIVFAHFSHSLERPGAGGLKLGAAAVTTTTSSATHSGCARASCGTMLVHRALAEPDLTSEVSGTQLVCCHGTPGSFGSWQGGLQQERQVLWNSRIQQVATHNILRPRGHSTPTVEGAAPGVVEDEHVADGGMQRGRDGQVMGTWIRRAAAAIHDDPGFLSGRLEVHEEVSLPSSEICILRVQINLNSKHRHLVPWQELCPVVMRGKMSTRKVANVPPVVGEASQTPPGTIYIHNFRDKWAEAIQHLVAQTCVDCVDALANTILRGKLLWGREVELLHVGDQ
mmetsp:Transcript_15453/g.33473  ORF Transcript_15453/g.33473 Transcript_15453/m.33473 type:complete len:297 (-) Transcript_15453:457-1347(-)